ncbi:hypothetical protein H310_08873 [Aphanomyces invadans]|uniref:Cyclic nucleotide-binding domain-containing protein n=1 Tax=Aphanomyces invadans TaxID=157072 RepID=A0A024TVW0_9STRA|nr:hypothetical protein H310_08873 [Aphanomyces invadans]ETV98129.1 hypothetical protein H310_08873 [Aphanomyces invadans]|eukprot:XP_008873004.1 hypothetical protein H310_08873 [Aphanomyces invadans]
MKKAKGKIKYCAQSLQAKFALRRMYMSGIDLSQQQLEFVVDFLERETIVHRMGWWQRLTHTERLALAKDIKLKYVYKGETVEVRTPELKVSYVLLRGSADGYIVDRPGQVPVHMRDGAVFGNLHFKNAVYAPTTHVGWVGDPYGSTAPKSKFQKVVLRGPVDCLVISADNLTESATALAHVTTLNCLHLFGMAMLEPYVRYRSFEPGTTMVHQGDAKSNFYIIVQGTAKASFKDDSLEAPAPVVSSLHLPGAPPAPPPPKDLDVAILGPQSYVGDISSLFDVPEPVTVKCTTNVEVVYFMLDELFEALKAWPAVLYRMQHVAFRTLDFLVERLQLLFGVMWSAHSTTHDTLTTALADFQLPPLPPLPEEEVATKAASNAASPAKPGSPTTRSSSPQRVPSPKKAPVSRADVTCPHVYVDTTGMAPVEPTKEMILAMHSMHSSFRKSAASTAAVGLFQPNDCLDLTHEVPAHATTLPLPPCIPPRKAKAKPSTNQLFLFPTMTKQRQYHAKSLPLLQKCSGIETPWYQVHK